VSTSWGGRRTAPRRPKTAPDRLTTARVEYRRPVGADAEEIFRRYASDPDVTRYLAWPRHITLADTRVFLEFSDGEWRSWGCGPYLIVSRASGALLGSTGISFDTAGVASTGYVLARDAWGQGYATEALGAMRDLGRVLDLRRLYAICHVDHAASRRVMEKCGFQFEGVLGRYLAFPNLGPDRHDVLCYAVEF
jgi:RimJ/RimL family protein N-acetyltransferase